MSPGLARDVTANLPVPDLDMIDDFYGEFLGLTTRASTSAGWPTGAHRRAARVSSW